jgi:hypothetical protein
VTLGRRPLRLGRIGAAKRGVADRSSAIKQVEAPACGGYGRSHHYLLDSSSTTRNGGDQLGSAQLGSGEPDPAEKYGNHGLM